MPSKPNEAHRARAEANFKKQELQIQEGDKVWVERAKAAATSDQNAARLKALRLAKEAADRAENAMTTGKARKTKRA